MRILLRGKSGIRDYYSSSQAKPRQNYFSHEKKKEEIKRRRIILLEVNFTYMDFTHLGLLLLAGALSQVSHRGLYQG